MADGPGEITRLLNTTPAADRLWELVYPQLRQRASVLLKRERRSHTLGTAGVVHETFERLMKQGPLEWTNRAQFYAVASRMMRRVLIDYARRRTASKRGAELSGVPLDEEILPDLKADPQGFEAANGALEFLAHENERAALGAALRVFGGLTAREVAVELGISERSVQSDWSTARERLRKYLAS